MAPAERVDWTPGEIEATVESYFRMLKLELVGEAYNKAAENRLLQQRLNGRTHSAVEFKHQNISAVLLENGWLYIDGYKPMKNVQRDLRNEVERQLRSDQSLERLMELAVQREENLGFDTPVVPALADVPDVVLGTAEWTPRIVGIKRDYIFRDTRNRKLGLDGERAAIEFERQRLTQLGKPKLASRVEHVAETVGDGLGYDVLLFEANGAERFIEVKTTRYARETPFFVTSNELRASEFFGSQFQLYRLFQFGKKSGLYALPGSLSSSCKLTPSTYVATPQR